jgi:hypothetical protein
MARHPLIGYPVWLVLFGAVFAWEGLALARVTGVPTLSDVFRVIVRYPVGPWALFAIWLWAGWHFSVVLLAPTNGGSPDADGLPFGLDHGDDALLSPGVGLTGVLDG